MGNIGHQYGQISTRLTFVFNELIFIIYCASEKIENFYGYCFILQREGHITSKVIAPKHTSRIGRKIGGQESVGEVVPVLHIHILHKLPSLLYLM